MKDNDIGDVIVLEADRDRLDSATWPSSVIAIPLSPTSAPLSERVED